MKKTIIVVAIVAVMVAVIAGFVKNMMELKQENEGLHEAVLMLGKDVVDLRNEINALEKENKIQYTTAQSDRHYLIQGEEVTKEEFDNWVKENSKEETLWEKLFG